jgi:hypothetical protein
MPRDQNCNGKSVVSFWQIHKSSILIATVGSALKAAVFTCCINLSPEIGASFALWITGE